MILTTLKSLLFLQVCRTVCGYVLHQENQSNEPLYLTPYINENRLEEGREAAKVSPLLGNVASYSGFLTVDQVSGKNLFFWYFPAENSQNVVIEKEVVQVEGVNLCLDGVIGVCIDDEDIYASERIVATDSAPVVLWLQGGPGVSSMYGLLAENGPYQLMPDGSLQLREYRWTKEFHMIYIDSPVGTGFSFANPEVVDVNEAAVSSDLYQALQQFFKLFPNLADNEFFIAGESYGGRYVPALGARIDYSNPTADLSINLKGLLIGNGVVDDEFMVYGDYLAQHGLIDLKDLPIWQQQEKEYRDMLKHEEYEAARILFNDFFAGITETGVSVYNFLETKEPGFNMLSDFFNAEIKQKIHVGNTTFNAANWIVNEKLWKGDFPSTVSQYTQPLLDKYRVMHYNGQLDIICHYPMAEDYTASLQWNGSEEFQAAMPQEWEVEGELAGYVTSGGNLYLVMVRNAGHMVPYYQPKVAYDLVTKFIFNKLNPSN